ncbi:MAG: hypothetical protein ACLTTQ_03300 [Christensenellales bacterium]
MTSNTENIASTADSQNTAGAVDPQTVRSNGAERENAAAGSGRFDGMGQTDRSDEGMLDRQRALIGDEATERLRGACCFSESAGSAAMCLRHLSAREWALSGSWISMLFHPQILTVR